MRGEVGAGDLRDLVVISREERTPDDMGGWTTSPVTLGEVWAYVRVPASKDGLLAGKETELRSHVVTVRQNGHTLGIRINDKILWRGQGLTIRSCRPLGREWVDFDCVLEVPG